MENIDKPIIVESATSNLNSSPKIVPKSFSWIKNPWLLRVLWGIMVICVIGLAVWGFLSIKNSTNQSEVAVNKIQPMTGGKMLLISSTKRAVVGNIIPVTVRVDTGGFLISGVDLILRYDPKKLLLKANGIENGNVFVEYPLKTVDQNNGLVKISGISSLSQIGFNGIGNFVTLNFLATDEGVANLKIDFKPGSTTESNIIDANSTQNIIDSVSDLNLKIVK